jgi:hypothetical protein
MPTLEATEIEQARQYFDQTRQRVVDVTSGLSEAQWQFKPAPGRWSIAEILEHMVTVEERVLGPVRQGLVNAPAPAADRNYREADAIIFAKIPDRSNKAEAPEAIHPTGKWTQAETLDRLGRNYARLIEFVESTPDLRAHELESPPMKFITQGAYTTWDGYQWALAAAAHDLRHVHQIAEVKSEPNYPR